MVSKAPLTKPRPIGAAHPKREISNFDGMRLTKELTEEILRGPLKVIGLIPFKLQFYLTKGFEGGPPLLNLSLSERIAPNAKYRISME